MGTANTAINKSNGDEGLLASGDGALADGSGNCATCCGGGGEPACSDSDCSSWPSSIDATFTLTISGTCCQIINDEIGEGVGYPAIQRVTYTGTIAGSISLTRQTSPNQCVYFASLTVDYPTWYATVYTGYTLDFGCYAPVDGGGAEVWLLAKRNSGKWRFWIILKSGGLIAAPAYYVVFNAAATAADCSSDFTAVDDATILTIPGGLGDVFGGAGGFIDARRCVGGSVSGTVAMSPNP